MSFLRPFRRAKRTPLSRRLSEALHSASFSRCPWLALGRAGYLPHGGSDEVWLYGFADGGVAERIRRFHPDGVICAHVYFDVTRIMEVRAQLEAQGAFSLGDAAPEVRDGLCVDFAILAGERENSFAAPHQLGRAANPQVRLCDYVTELVPLPRTPGQPDAEDEAPVAY